MESSYAAGSWVRAFLRAVWVYIRYFWWGLYWFRSYSGSLLIERKSKQNALAPPLGTSLTLGVPALRLWTVGRRDGPSLAQRG